MRYVELASGTVLETDRLDLWPEAKRLTAKEGKRRLFDESAARLRELFAPDGEKRKTMYTTVTHVARSGMSRSIRCFAMSADGPADVTHHVGRVIGAPIDEKNGGVKVGGCGMDMGFHVVYAVGATLWPKGTAEPHSTRNREPDTDGGYAILHRWL